MCDSCLFLERLLRVRWRDAAGGEGEGSSCRWVVVPCEERGRSCPLHLTPMPTPTRCGARAAANTIGLHVAQFPPYSRPIKKPIKAMKENKRSLHLRSFQVTGKGMRLSLAVQFPFKRMWNFVTIGITDVGFPFH